MSKNYHIDANKEMIAFGMMNILGSFTSCYPTLAVGNIDTSGINMFKELKKNTDIKGLKLFLANPRGEVIEKLNKSKLIEAIGQKRIYLTVGDAFEACNSMLYASKPKQLAIESDYSLISEMFQLPIELEEGECTSIVDSVFVAVFVIAIEFGRLTSPLSSILANPSTSASTHQTNHGLTEPVRNGEADDGENGRWGQQRMEDGDDGGRRGWRRTS
ncbi:hypothetical protein RHGRI_035786 [Rhododendron griersonianum]|uniref:STAS domain-containing protein n=1 Tax=Rhododendron griersonianum TaxID=479676 RepID=A0AAV6HR66_9ERIC|nr:hypothetical protein RHGRI_035786 [Rhododendron griersonianum]